MPGVGRGLAREEGRAGGRAQGAVDHRVLEVGPVVTRAHVGHVLDRRVESDRRSSRRARSAGGRGRPRPRFAAAEEHGADHDHDRQPCGRVQGLAEPTHRCPDAFAHVRSAGRAPCAWEPQSGHHRPVPADRCLPAFAKCLATAHYGLTDRRAADRPLGHRGERDGGGERSGTSRSQPDVPNVCASRAKRRSGTSEGRGRGKRLLPRSGVWSTCQGPRIPANPTVRGRDAAKPDT